MAPFMIPAPQGSTKVYVIIGSPVSQVRAPLLMNEIFAKAGTDCVMVPMEVSIEAAPDLIKALKSVGNVGGFLATIPHKFELLAHAQNIGAVAEAAGCANALRREWDGTWTAENFDGVGFVSGMAKSSYEVTGKTVSIYGAGGAGSSIAAALLDAGAKELIISDPSSARTAQLCARLNSHWPKKTTFAAAGNHLDADIVVNATPVGLSVEDPLPFSLDGLNPHAVVAEIIMKPAETRLLREARARGLRTQEGFEMLQPQIDLYRQFFRIPDPHAGETVNAASRGNET